MAYKEELETMLQGFDWHVVVHQAIDLRMLGFRVCSTAVESIHIEDRDVCKITVAELVQLSP